MTGIEFLDEINQKTGPVKTVRMTQDKPCNLYELEKTIEQAYHSYCQKNIKQV